MHPTNFDEDDILVIRPSDKPIAREVSQNWNTHIAMPRMAAWWRWCYWRLAPWGYRWMCNSTRGLNPKGGQLFTLIIKSPHPRGHRVPPHGYKINHHYFVGGDEGGRGEESARMGRSGGCGEERTASSAMRLSPHPTVLRAIAIQCASSQFFPSPNSTSSGTFNSATPHISRATCP